MIEKPPSSRVVYMIGILDELRDAGGTLASSEVADRLKAHGMARIADLEKLQDSGETRFAKELRFARLELARAGLIESGSPGQWGLSAIGWGCFPTVQEAQALISRRRRGPLDTVDNMRGAVGPTTGPRPSGYSTTMVRSIAEPSFAYALRFGSSDIWKIGHTQNLENRLKQIRCHVPDEILGMNWEVFATHACHDSLQAFALEQALFAMLREYRTTGERIGCSRTRLVAAWRSVCQVMPLCNAVAAVMDGAIGRLVD
jgi:hypothetical protein